LALGLPLQDFENLAETLGAFFALASIPFALRRLAGACVRHAAMMRVRKGPKPDDNLV
jgi:hypothetical protein